MVPLESNSATTAVDPPRTDRPDTNGVGTSETRSFPGDEFEDDMAPRGVVAIDIARDVIAPFSGTLILNALPERKPEILFV